MPHYLVYSRQNRQLRYFQLIKGLYEEQPISTSNPLIWLDDLEIGLGRWEGIFDEVPGFWLRWCDRQGNWFPTDTERAELVAEQERLAKEQAEQQAEQERQRTEQERLAKERSQNQVLQSARNLLAAGMELNQVVQLLNLSVEQIQWLNDQRS